MRRTGVALGIGIVLPVIVAEDGLERLKVRDVALVPVIGRT